MLVSHICDDLLFPFALTCSYCETYISYAFTTTTCNIFSLLMLVSHICDNLLFPSTHIAYALTSLVVRLPSPTIQPCYVLQFVLLSRLPAFCSRSVIGPQQQLTGGSVGIGLSVSRQLNLNLSLSSQSSSFRIKVPQFFVQSSFSAKQALQVMSPNAPPLQ